ncbi:MAG: hypothetical protein D9V47_09965 [Clostridia bacterium]|nr:MAG: hypothetical protein D9V47_09965 [Clostridia bacterium]
MSPSPKVEKLLAAIRQDQLTRGEASELLQLLAREFAIPIRLKDEAGQEDFWALTPEEEAHLHDLLARATGDLTKKRYHEYTKPRA